MAQGMAQKTLMTVARVELLVGVTLRLRGRFRKGTLSQLLSQLLSNHSAQKMSRRKKKFKHLRVQQLRVHQILLSKTQKIAINTQKSLQSTHKTAIKHKTVSFQT